METKYLETLKTIQACGSFAGAAEKLSYTKSTVTFHVRQLEEELQLQLFEKIGRRMVLTQEGRQVLTHAETILAEEAQMKALHKSPGDPSGDLRVSVAESLFTYQLQPLIQAFRKRAPKVSLSIYSEDCAGMSESIAKGDADIGLHYRISPEDERLHYQDAGTFQLCVIGPVSFAGKPYTIADLIQAGPIPIVSDEPEGYFENILTGAIRSSGGSVGTRMVLSNAESILKAVQGEFGIALLPAFSSEAAAERGEVMRLDMPLSPGRITAICTWRKSRQLTPAMKCFLDLAEETLR